MKRSIRRRDILKGAGSIVVLHLLSACEDGSSKSGSAGELPSASPPVSFLHGVASGDPLEDAVILWTRVSPDDDSYSGRVSVVWEIAADESFSTLLASGVTQAGPERDYCVKLDATGLQPYSQYYYRFRVGDEVSPIGRTKTAPSSAVDSLRFAVASCSNYGVGYFHAYRHIAEQQDIDAVLHLGDYIYEYGQDSEEGEGLCFFRGCNPEKEILTLADYRGRHAEYKSDPDLQAAHAAHAWIVTWDDHEFADNTWRDGANNHSDEDEGDWPSRKAVAVKVYDEWMPIRLPDADRPDKIFRRLAYGDLVDLIMLDTRSYGRDEQLSSPTPVIGVGTLEPEALDDPNRTILGAEQLSWLNAQLTQSTAQWKLLGQQVIFAPLQLLGQPSTIGSGTIINADAWDGYRASRQRVLDIIESNNIDDVVVLTGDVHSSWALDVARDPYDPAAYNPLTGEGAVAVEFVTPGVTMPGVPGQEGAQLSNPHVHYTNTTQNGYMVVEFTASEVQAQWWHVSDVRLPDSEEFMARAITAQAGNNHLDRLPAS